MTSPRAHQGRSATRRNKRQPFASYASSGVNPSDPLSSQQTSSSPEAGQQQEQVDEGKQQVEHDSHAGYAVLHDFCMMIPYSILAFVASTVLFFTPPLRMLALPLATAGGIALATSVMSLRLWKQGQRTTPLTLTTAAFSGGAAYYGWLHLRTSLTLGLGGPVVSWLATAITLLSGLLALFCVYNVLAGGNPPRQGSH